MCARSGPRVFFRSLSIAKQASEHGHCGLRRTRQSLSPQAPLLGAPSLTSALKRSPSSGCRSWRGMMPNDRQISRSLSGFSVLRARNSRLPRRSLATNPGLPRNSAVGSRSPSGRDCRTDAPKDPEGAMRESTAIASLSIRARALALAAALSSKQADWQAKYLEASRSSLEHVADAFASNPSVGES